MTFRPDPPALVPGQTVVVTRPNDPTRYYGTYVGPALPPPGYEGKVVKVQVPNYIYEWTRPVEAVMATTASRDMVAGDLIPLADLKAAYERPFLGTLWTYGDRGILTPIVCDVSFGDGLKLLKIATIHQRPNFHAVRIDSGWDDDDISEAMDDILSAIEEECGPAGVYLDQPCESCGDTACKCSDDYDASEAFPALDDRDGCSWSLDTFADMLRAIDQIDRSPLIDVPAAGQGRSMHA